MAIQLITYLQHGAFVLTISKYFLETKHVAYAILIYNTLKAVRYEICGILSGREQAGFNTESIITRYIPLFNELGLKNSIIEQLQFLQQ